MTRRVKPPLAPADAAVRQAEAVAALVASVGPHVALTIKVSRLVVNLLRAHGQHADGDALEAAIYKIERVVGRCRVHLAAFEAIRTLDAARAAAASADPDTPEGTA